MADILFVHPDFPGQFQWLVRHLSTDRGNRIKAFAAGPSDNRPAASTADVDIHHYGAEVVADRPPEHVLAYTDTFIRNAASLALKAEELRHAGFDPDVIYTHAGWGAGAFLHNV